MLLFLDTQHVSRISVGRGLALGKDLTAHTFPEVPCKEVCWVLCNTVCGFFYIMGVSGQAW